MRPSCDVTSAALGPCLCLAPVYLLGQALVAPFRWCKHWGRGTHHVPSPSLEIAGGTVAGQLGAAIRSRSPWDLCPTPVHLTWG